MNWSNQPHFEISYQSLPRDPKQRHAVFVDLFGQWLFRYRNQALETSAKLVRSEESRAKLGNIRRKPYDLVAALPPEQHDAAVRLAEATLNQFLERLIWSLGDEGVDCRFDDDHAYRFRMQAEIVDSKSGEIVEDEPVNRGGTFFGKNWGRWLNRFAAHWASPKTEDKGSESHE